MNETSQDLDALNVGRAEVQEVSGVHRTQVLSAAECELWELAVFAQQRNWTRRHPDVPFFTLGMAAYLDNINGDASLGGKRPYQELILRRHSNDMIALHFMPLLRRCASGLEQVTNMRCDFLPAHTALPGFHIYLPDPAFEGPVASVHRDLQFKSVFPGMDAATHAPLTFTLPISLPSGAGLNRWTTETPEFEPYHLGEMIVHDGLVAHQAVLLPKGGRTPRIMLQGHAWRRNGSYIMYW